MLKDSDVVFITTTLNSKWLSYQRSLISKFFPESQHLIIDGSSNWPYAWFYWMKDIKSMDAKWFVHIDEDCFLTGRDELEKLIEKMETEGITVSAVSDGYNHYRGANPVAINSFFMVGNVQDFNDLDFNIDEIKFWHEADGWRNNKGILYNGSKHRSDFNYPHEIMGNNENCSYEQEPYYMVLWMLKEGGKKFNYLYPHFDERFKSTNPRISKESNDLAIHMWYTRLSETNMDVHGMPNYLRYQKVESHIKENLL